MRIWTGVDAAALRGLRDGSILGGTPVRAASEDEQDEHDALLAAAEDGPVVVVAEVADGAEVDLDSVEAFHVDADGSGVLAWYATQELDAVLEVLDAGR